jgi:hypothetical protein
MGDKAKEDTGVGTERRRGAEGSRAQSVAVGVQWTNGPFDRYAVTPYGSARTLLAMFLG